MMVIMIKVMDFQKNIDPIISWILIFMQLFFP